MANTHFSGPVISANGFVGDVTGNISGTYTVGTIKSADGVTAVTIANTTANATFVNSTTIAILKTGSIKSADNVTAITIANVTGASTFVNTTALATVTISAGVTMADSANIAVNATTGTTIAGNAAQKLSFHGLAPAILYATEGTLTGFTAGGGTTATDKSTFTGNTGTKAYTVGDIVLALKTKGIMAA